MRERGLILKGFASFVVLDAVKCPFQIKEGGERREGNVDDAPNQPLAAKCQ